MAPCGEMPEAAAFPGRGFLRPSVRGVWACREGDGGGGGGGFMGRGGGLEGSCAAVVFLRASLGEPEAELSGRLEGPRFSTGTMHTLHVLAQYGANSKTRALGQRCPDISLQKGDGGGEEGWKLGQGSTSRADMSPS